MIIFTDEDIAYRVSMRLCIQWLRDEYKPSSDNSFEGVEIGV